MNPEPQIFCKRVAPVEEAPDEPERVAPGVFAD